MKYLYLFILLFLLLGCSSNETIKISLKPVNQVVNVNANTNDVIESSDNVTKTQSNVSVTRKLTR